MEPVLLKFTDRDILREFYVRQYTSEGYTASTDAPFLHELHDYKLGRLRGALRPVHPGRRTGHRRRLRPLPVHRNRRDVPVHGLRRRSELRISARARDRRAPPVVGRLRRRSGAVRRRAVRRAVRRRGDRTRREHGGDVTRMVAYPQAGRGCDHHDAEQGASGRCGGPPGVPLQPRSSARAFLPRTDPTAACRPPASTLPNSPVSTSSSGCKTCSMAGAYRTSCSGKAINGSVSH